MKFQTVFFTPFGFFLFTLLGLSTGGAWSQTCQNDLLTTPSSDFNILSGGLAEHKSTGLVWARCALGQQWDGQTCQGSTEGQTWAESLNRVETANAQAYLDHSDWRLPNIKELSSIVELGCFDDAINTTIFPNTASIDFWSTSVYADNSDVAWHVNFNDGGDHFSSKNVIFAIRLVRGGQSIGSSTAPDTSPFPFSFSTKIDVAKNTIIVSDTIIITGINSATNMSVSNGEYRINQGDWVTDNGQVNQGDQVQLRHRSSTDDETSMISRLTVGDVSATFSSITLTEVTAQPETPGSSAEGFVTGHLTDLCHYDAVEFAEIKFSGQQVYEQQSDDRGRYSLKLSAGSYDIEIDDPDYKLRRSSVKIKSGFRSELDFALEPVGGCASVQQPARSYKAIIVAGSGSSIAGGVRNPIWPVTQELTQLAYASLRQQGFNARDIRFFAADSFQDPDNIQFQGELSINTLGQSVMEWAADVDQVLLYIVSHGGDANLRLNSSEILSAQLLDSALDHLQQQINGKLVVVLEACYSGSFLQELVAENRVVITSSDSDQLAVLAGASNQSFSHGFWPRLAKSGQLLDAFIEGSLAIANNTVDTNNGFQQSLLDADSNGVYNRQDRSQLSGFCLGQCKQFADDAPVISSVGPEITLNGELEVALGVQVSELLNPLERVWVSVQRPDYTFPEDVAISDLPVLELSCNADQFCQVNYPNFDRSGDYLFHFHAKDSRGQAARSKTLLIEQTQDSGESAQANVVYLPGSGLLTIDDVQVQDQHYSANLQLLDAPGLVFKLLDAQEMSQQSHDFPALYDIFSLELTLPGVVVGNEVYDAVLINQGGFRFAVDFEQTIKR